MAKAARKTAAQPAPARAPAPKARLGDDLPATPAAPKLSREPVSLVVARSHIAAGKVRIRIEAPKSLRVARGQVVHVKHAYRLQEHSEEREEYRFLLKSRLGDREHAPSLERLGDQWGVPEDIGGYLQHEYTLSTPGRHVLSFDVGSEYCVFGWGKAEVRTLEREEASGRIEVVVG